jgi:hypothetical protein
MRRFTVMMTAISSTRIAWALGVRRHPSAVFVHTKGFGAVNGDAEIVLDGGDEPRVLRRA